MNPANKVFGCDDLCREILSNLTYNRCQWFRQRMLNDKPSIPKYYCDSEWSKSVNSFQPEYCDWCYHYVFKYN